LHLVPAAFALVVVFALDFGFGYAEPWGEELGWVEVFLEVAKGLRGGDAGWLVNGCGGELEGCCSSNWRRMKN
jgi:hypothetical protein